MTHCKNASQEHARRLDPQCAMGLQAEVAILTDASLKHHSPNSQFGTTRTTQDQAKLPKQSIAHALP